MKGKSIKICISIILVIMMLSAIVVSNIPVTHAAETTKEVASKLETSKIESKTIGFSKGQENLGVNDDPSNYNDSGDGGSWIVKGNGNMYCNQHEVGFMSEIIGHYITESDVDRVKGTKKQRGSKPVVENEGKATIGYLKKSETQSPEDYVAVGKNREAYVLTYPNMSTWSRAKQDAYWGADNSINREAKKYVEYYKKISSKKVDGKPTLGIQNKTNEDNVKTSVNQDENYLLIGPFSLDYIYSYYKNENVAFGGISDMYFKGYNSKGTEVKNRLEVVSYIAKTGDGDSKEYTNLHYFTPANDSYTDKKEQVYPKGTSQGEKEFYLKIKNPNDGVKNANNYIANVKLSIEFKWMEVTEAKIQYMDGEYYTVDTSRRHYTDCTGELNRSYQENILICGLNHIHNDNCYRTETRYYHVHTNNCTMYVATTEKGKHHIQNHIAVISGKRTLHSTSLEIGKAGIPVTMDLGGTVWEEVSDNKESAANGLKDSKDRVIPNVKVTLYTQDGKVANLLTNPNEQGISNEELMHRINPTYTDSEGNYLFKGIDPMKRYYVKFEYNGQTYLPTDYLKYGSGYSTVNAVINTKVDADKYNTANWNNSSKGTETVSDRNNYDNKFANIGSAPLNYKSSNSLNSGKLVNGYNEAFSQYELMGFVLDSDGKYHVDSSKALIDGFYTVYSDGNIGKIETLQEGRISREIKEYIKANKKSPDATAMRAIYSKIAGNDTTLWRKLQFIEDCKIASYTQGQGQQKDLYPVYKKFTINTANSRGEYDTKTRVIGKDKNGNNVAYPAIYPGQLHVNQGLWRRQETDLALRKDIAFAATRVNGKTEVYKYDKRGSNDDYWQIQLRMRDYNNYYGTNYTREVYKADYAYRSANTNGGTGKDLELYVTYKITVRNNSLSIVTEVKELVDYYDKDYTYIDNLSWVTYSKKVSESEYHNTIDTLENKISDRSVISSANASQYGEASHSDMRKEHNYLYIKGLEGHKLKSGEEAYVYLTFKVNKDGENPVKLDDDGTYKQNYVEINGYSTYYRDNTKLPNNQTKNSSDVAGLIDFNSTPGNLSLDDLVGDKPEKNFENDTDRAKSIKVTLDTTSTRSINGTVWEDKRNYEVSNAMIGNGIYENETGINGVTVELVEKLNNENEFVWQKTTTGSNTVYRKNITDGKWESYEITPADGYYEFSGSIPGQYFVRFQYGDTTATALTNINSNGGSNAVSYNGQDFKSTVYQKNMLNGENVDGSTTTPEKDTFDKVTTYNIASADAKGRLSDAKDIMGANPATAKTANVEIGKSTKDNNLTWKGRTAVNNYSSSNVKNDVAEVLTSPYKDTSKINTLIENTRMVAETGIIDLEGEYNRQTTDGTNQATDNNRTDNAKNGNYTLNNVDFGLVERPKAQLELGKKVTNVKVTLANGSTLFDAVKGTKDLAWKPGTEYALNKQNSIRTGSIYKEHYDYTPTITDNGLITVTMDDELMHGATIQISYELTVTNVGEVDYTGQNFYYKGSVGDGEVVTTKADVVLDYVSNNLQYRAKDNESKVWEVIKTEAVKSNEGVNAKNIDKFNTILKTDKLNTNLKPGDKTDPTKLVLTQLMTSQNTADDRAYNNIAEITTISNDVGRRMAFSIQGNQDPTKAPAEVDSAKSEQVLVLPPFGIGNMIVYITIAIVTLAILSGGIILIKKKVLKK